MEALSRPDGQSVLPALQALSEFDLEYLGDDQYRLRWGYQNEVLNGGLIFALGAKLTQTVHEHRRQVERQVERQG
jgi:hypothetical protein